MYEVIEKFEQFLVSKGYKVHESLNPATGQRVISWIHEKKLIAGAAPAGYFDKFYKESENSDIDEKSIGEKEFQILVDKFTEGF